MNERDKIKQQIEIERKAEDFITKEKLALQYAIIEADGKPIANACKVAYVGGYHAALKEREKYVAQLEAERQAWFDKEKEMQNEIDDLNTALKQSDMGDKYLTSLI